MIVKAGGPPVCPPFLEVTAIFKKTGKMLVEMVHIYYDKRIGRSAAAVAYSTALTIFPFLICLNALLGMLNISEGDIARLADGVIPARTVEILENYIAYISVNNSRALLIAGAAVMLSSSTLAFLRFIRAMEDFQGRSRFNGLLGTVEAAALSILIFFVLFISLVVIVSGEGLIDLIVSRMGFVLLPVFWRRVRFIVLFVLLYAITYLLYFVSSPAEGKKIPRSGGAAIAAILLVPISILFSYFVNMSSNYSLVYGSLASVVILTVWLNLCSTVMILGNLYNVIAVKYR